MLVGAGGPSLGRGWNPTRMAPPPYGQQACGMHPTGMLSCLGCVRYYRYY